MVEGYADRRFYLRSGDRSRPMDEHEVARAYAERDALERRADEFLASPWARRPLLIPPPHGVVWSAELCSLAHCSDWRLALDRLEHVRDLQPRFAQMACLTSRHRDWTTRGTGPSSKYRSRRASCGQRTRMPSTTAAKSSFGRKVCSPRQVKSTATRATSFGATIGRLRGSTTSCVSLRVSMTIGRSQDRSE